MTEVYVLFGIAIGILIGWMHWGQDAFRRLYYGIRKTVFGG